MFLKNLFGGVSPEREAAIALYLKAVEKARDPALYLDFGVPDTVNGRFDMIILQVTLIIRRLRDVTAGSAQQATAQRVAQELFDYMFQDMDRSLRELGVGDMSIGKQIKKMAKAFYGRASAIEAGLESASVDNAVGLSDALRETVFRHAPDVAPNEVGISGMTQYLLRATAHLKQQCVETIMAGTVDCAVSVRAA